MLKYVETLVAFSEVPDEITLCINISNCPCNCEECHSSHLAKDIGRELNTSTIYELIKYNQGITCIAFMGGDKSPYEVNYLAQTVKFVTDNKLKVAWYSGRQELAEDINLKYFDFIKLGPYIKDVGPLNCPTTNQRFYKVQDNKLIDITYKFWKDETND